MPEARVKEIVTSEPITTREKNLLETIRRIPHGQLTIFIDEGKPIRIEKIKESITL